MTGTLQDALAVARANVGFVEGPNNANPYAGEVGHANHQPWCASFLAAVMKRAGVTIPNTSAYTPTMSNGFKAANIWHDAPRVGDVVFYRWPSLGRIAHVGLVETVNADGSIVAIEGNTDYAGGRSGGRVMRQVRRANIAGYGRPAYADAPSAPPSAPPPAPPAPPHTHVPAYPGLTREGMRNSGATRAYQQRLKDRGWRITVDGDHGKGTTAVLRAFQAEKGLGADGVGGQNTWRALWATQVTR